VGNTISTVSRPKVPRLSPAEVVEKGGEGLHHSPWENWGRDGGGKKRALVRVVFGKKRFHLKARKGKKSPWQKGGEVFNHPAEEEGLQGGGGEGRAPLT